MSRPVCQYAFLSLVVLSLVCLDAELAWPQSKARDRQDERKENARVLEAQKSVDKAKERLQEEQKRFKIKLREVDSHEKSLMKEKRKLRESKDARAELDRCAAPILEKLHASAEWKAIQKRVQEAKDRREELLSDTELSEETRNEQLNAINAIVKLPLLEEAKACATDQKWVAANEMLSSAMEKLDKLRSKISKSEIESHPETIAAEKRVVIASKELMAESRSLANLRTALRNAQLNLVSAQSKLTKAKGEDSRDKNK
jgi:chromosome segregation ATPase